MATSIGQYTPVFLLGERPSLVKKPGSPQSTTLQSDATKVTLWHRCKTYFACGSSVPVRAECEVGAAAWLAGTLLALSVQGHGLPPLQELWP